MIKIEDVRNDNRLFDEFIQENMRLVSMVIKTKFRYVNNTTDYDDYFQTGCIGLVKAAKRYDPKFGTAFSTYAIPLIEGEIMRYRRDYCITNIHTPRSVKDKYFRYQALKESGLEDSEIIRELDIKPYELRRIICAVGGSCSIDTPVYENTQMTGVEMIASTADTEGESLGRLELKEKLMLAKRVLSKKDYIILILHLRNNTQTSIAKKLGISQTHVSRRLGKIREVCGRVGRWYELGLIKCMAV